MEENIKWESSNVVHSEHTVAKVESRQTGQRKRER